MNETADIKGGKLFFVENKKCFSIGSREINQSEIKKISNIPELDKVIFYCIKFISVDFSVFSSARVNQLTFLHGNCSKINLEQICKIPSIKVIQLLDTNVSNEEITSIKVDYPNILFK